jgi:tRNA(Ile)-lysidine synthase
MGLMYLLIDKLGIRQNRVVVGHVDHGIRADSGEDANFVRGAAGQLGVEYLESKVDVPGFICNNRMSLEAAARVLRYEALGQMAVESGCHWILTGHTLDDSAETVLMRMRNRSPWYEWTGIPEKRGRILRPLIRVSRKVLRAWVEENGIPFREDLMNQDLRFMRSRLRKTLQDRPDFWTSSRVQDYADAGMSLEEALQSAKRLYEAVRQPCELRLTTGSVGLAIDKIFRYFNRLTFLPVEVEWADLAAMPGARLPSSVRQQIGQFLAGKGPQARIILPKGFCLERRGGRVWILRVEFNTEVCQRVVQGKNIVAQKTLTMEISTDADGAAGHAVHLRGELFQRELIVRNWQPGDRIRCVGRPTKKISDLLAEQKVDPAVRAQTLVLADADGPLMILGGAVAQRALDSDPQLNTLRISWNEHDGNGA